MSVTNSDPVAWMRESLQDVQDYFKDQGTGRVFHLGYKNDKKKEEKLRNALANLPARAENHNKAISKKPLKLPGGKG